MALNSLALCLRPGRNGVPDQEMHEMMRYGLDFLIGEWRIRQGGACRDLYPAIRPSRSGRGYANFSVVKIFQEFLTENNGFFRQRLAGYGIHGSCLELNIPIGT